MQANQVSEQILALVSGQPGFGGLWVDRAGLTHIGVTPAEAGRFEAMLDPRFAGEFVLERRATTYPELVRRRDRVTAMMPKLRAAGLDLLEWGPDEKSGALWVSLKQYTPEKAAKVREMLGQDVRVEPAMATGGPGDVLSARLN